MKYIMIQPATVRFQWELDVQLTNLTNLGIKGEDIVLIFAQYWPHIPKYFEDKYGVKTYTYADDREDRSYIPSIKPYLWWKFLQYQPWAQKETWFYMDCDVIFREIPKVSGVSSRVWLCSDTDSYLSPTYIKSKGGTLFEDMQDIVGVNVEDWDGKSGGAQWVIKNPSPEYWKEVYDDCNTLYKYMASQENTLQVKYGKEYMPIQAWTAEMWAQLWNLQNWDIEPKIVKELDFCMSTDDIERWDEVKILHNAGVTTSAGGFFFKGHYDKKKTPFDVDLSRTRKDKCTYRYVQAILEAKKSVSNPYHKKR